MSGVTPQGDVRRYRFGPPGARDTVDLELWQTEDDGAINARLWCAASARSLFEPELYIEVATDPDSISHLQFDDLMKGAYEGDDLAATDLASELEEMAYEEWLKDNHEWLKDKGLDGFA